MDRPPCGGVPPPLRSPRSLSGILSSSVGPVITKVPQNGGRASTENRAPTVLEAGSPRSKLRQIQCVVRSASWFVAGHLLAVSSWARRGRGALWDYPLDASILFYLLEAPPPVTTKPGIRFRSIYELWRTQIFSLYQPQWRHLENGYKIGKWLLDAWKMNLALLGRSKLPAHPHPGGMETPHLASSHQRVCLSCLLSDSSGSWDPP